VQISFSVTFCSLHCSIQILGHSPSVSRISSVTTIQQRPFH